MTNEEALAKINSRLTFGMKPGLRRIKELLGELGDPQKQLKFAHVAVHQRQGHHLRPAVLRPGGGPGTPWGCTPPPMWRTSGSGFR